MLLLINVYSHVFDGISTSYTGITYCTNMKLATQQPYTDENKGVVMGFPILSSLAEIFFQIIKQKFCEAVPSFPV